MLIYRSKILAIFQAYLHDYGSHDPYVTRGNWLGEAQAGCEGGCEKLSVERSLGCIGGLKWRSAIYEIMCFPTIIQKLNKDI